MSNNTALDVRMKRYEHAFRQYLPRRSYTLIRLDGRAFHTYLAGCDKPFDAGFAREMALVSQRLCEEIAGVRFAYTQSDEISLLLTDFDSTHTEPWFGGNRDKLVSVSASLAGAYLMKLRQWWGRVPMFDCRVWSMSDPVEVANYFVWRQRDSTRNSVQGAGQKYFDRLSLEGKSTDEIQEMLFQYWKINWSDYPPEFKRGQLIAPVYQEGWLTTAAPTFKAEPGTMLAQLIPALPNLHAD